MFNDFAMMKKDLLKTIHSIITKKGVVAEKDKNRKYIEYNGKHYIIWCGKFMMYSNINELNTMSGMTELSENELKQFIKEFE